MAKEGTLAPSKTSRGNPPLQRNPPRKRPPGASAKGAPTKAPKKQPQTAIPQLRRTLFGEKDDFPCSLLFPGVVAGDDHHTCDPRLPIKAGWVTNEDGEINNFLRGILFPTSKPPLGRKPKSGKLLPMGSFQHSNGKGLDGFEFRNPKATGGRLEGQSLPGSSDSTDNILTGDKSNKVLKLKRVKRTGLSKISTWNQTPVKIIGWILKLWTGTTMHMNGKKKMPGCAGRSSVDPEAHYLLRPG